MKFALALVLGLSVGACNDDLLGYRLARLAAADAPANADAPGAADAAADATQPPPTDTTTDWPAELPPEAGGDPCPSLNCTDDSQCTDDGCADGKCVFKAIEGSCEDGDMCTGPDSCQKGICTAGPPKDCDDNQPCTLDSCVKTAGCDNKPNDGGTCKVDACSTEGKCIGTSCVGSDTASCDDENPCTSDSCDAKSGCTHAPKKGECSDGNGCTADDVCNATGKCTGGKGCDVNATCKKDAEFGEKCVCNPGFGGDGFTCLGE